MKPLLWLVGLIVALAAPWADAADASSRTNVIIILADDLGYGDLGCYGHPKFKTPNLDRMAAEGARLTQFNTPTPFCAPTRASLLTGRYPFRCGMTANPAPIGGRTPSWDCRLRRITLAELFRGAATRPAWSASGISATQRRSSIPCGAVSTSTSAFFYSNDMRPVQLIDGEKVVEYPVVQATLTKRYTERALKFIDRNQDKPFFLYFAHAMPHKPLAASEEFYKKSGAGLYGDAIAELDASVGQVLAKLKELGLDENTFVVFTSDNGPWYGGSTAACAA